MINDAVKLQNALSFFANFRALRASGSFRLAGMPSSIFKASKQPVKPLNRDMSYKNLLAEMFKL
jgi:hypothetical protein